MRKLIVVTLNLIISLCAYAQSDTLRLSSSYTTHILFDSDLSYVNLSDPRLLSAMIVEKNRNVLALKANASFVGRTNITALEANGQIHSFIVIYESDPSSLVIDMKHRADSKIKEDGRQGLRNAPHVSMTDLYSSKRALYHLSVSKYGIRVNCEDIVTYGDVLYLVISLENNTSTDYVIDAATFNIETRKKASRAAAGSHGILPRNRYGGLSAPAGKKGREVYSFDKLTLDKGEVLKVYFYEADDQRNLVLEIYPADLSSANK